MAVSRLPPANAGKMSGVLFPSSVLLGRVTFAEWLCPCGYAHIADGFRPPIYIMYDSDSPPEYLQQSRNLHCLNCMSTEARRLKLSGFQWLIAPLVVPVMCNRCLTSYYYPRFLLLLDRIHGGAQDRLHGRAQER